MANREKIIEIFGCSDCVALEDCLTDKPMNFCDEKRNYLRKILALYPDIEDIDGLRTRLTELEKKLDDREEGLVEAEKQEAGRISSLIANIELNADDDFDFRCQVIDMATKLKGE